MMIALVFASALALAMGGAKETLTTDDVQSLLRDWRLHDKFGHEVSFRWYQYVIL